MSIGGECNAVVRSFDLQEKYSIHMMFNESFVRNRRSCLLFPPGKKLYELQIFIADLKVEEKV